MLETKPRAAGKLPGLAEDIILSLRSLYPPDTDDGGRDGSVTAAAPVVTDGLHSPGGDGGRHTEPVIDVLGRGVTVSQLQTLSKAPTRWDGRLPAKPTPAGQRGGAEPYGEPVDHLTAHGQPYDGTGPVDSMAPAGPPAILPDPKDLSYEDGYLRFQGIDRSRVRLARFDGKRSLADIDPSDVSERDVSVLRALYGIMLEDGTAPAGGRAGCRIGLDRFLELAGRGPEDPGDRVGQAMCVIGSYNGLIGRAADGRAVCMIDLVYHGGNSDTVSLTSQYLDGLLGTAPPLDR